MDPEAQSDDEYTSPAAADEQEFTSHGGGMFAGSWNFTVAGGTFSNLTTNNVSTPAVPTGCRMIPLGDIDLQQQLSVESGLAGIIGCRQERRCVRRVYSAKVDGRQSNVTVAMYQGDGAQEDWREDVEVYLALRHPNIVQVCGGASHGNIHATVFHGDLVPFEQYMAPCSPIMTVYLFACWGYEYDRTVGYLRETLKLRGGIGSSDYQMWIRRSTGRLCMDLVTTSPPEPRFSRWITSRSSCDNERIASTIASWRIINLDASSHMINRDAEAIEFLTIHQYLDICCTFPLGLLRGTQIAPTEIVNLGAVVYRDHTDAEIASLVDVPIAILHNPGDTVDLMVLTERRLDGENVVALIHRWPNAERVENRIKNRMENRMENQWTRYQAYNVFDSELSMWYHGCLHHAWLSQAHHIFTCRQITSHFDDYVFVDALFLCPSEAFKTGPWTVKWPDCPAYWSLDPSGVEGLSTEEATRLGFPSMELRTQIEGLSWDANVYAGLRQFHEAKGFDPASQDVARHMGYPLYRVSGAMDAPFAHAEEVATEEANDEESLKDLTEDEPAEQGNILHHPSDRDTEDPPVGSPWFNLVMHTQLALIIFLFICQMYDQLY